MKSAPASFEVGSTFRSEILILVSLILKKYKREKRDLVNLVFSSSNMQKVGIFCFYPSPSPFPDVISLLSRSLKVFSLKI